MRFCALDASQNESDLNNALDALEPHAPERLFLFRSAYFGTQARLQAQQQADDEGFLDTAEHWLLDQKENESGSPPKRSPPSPFVTCSTGVLPHSEEGSAKLPSNEQAMEIVGPIIAMAVPTREDIADLDNAAIWIFGGSAKPVLEEADGHVLLSPGDLCDQGGLLSLSFGRAGKIRARLIGPGGKVMTTKDFDISPSTKMSVQG